MSDNLYSTPSATLEKPEHQVARSFYVVSSAKFWVLFMATVGLYQIYWFYSHWRAYKAATGASVWPVPRGIFSIFFAHSLFRHIDAALQQSGRAFVWSPAMMASLYVVMALLANICDRLSGRGVGSPVTDFIGIAALPIVGWCLYQAQQVANLAMGDPQGESNSRFTPANMAWIVLGLAFWVLVVLGLLVMAFPEYFPD